MHRAQFSIHISRYVVMTLSLCLPMLAKAQTIEDARRVAESYSKMVISRDIDSIVELTNHVLISDLGGRASARKWLSDKYQHLVEIDAQPIGEQIGRVREYHDEQVDLFFVETIRSFDAFPKDSQPTYFYVLSSYDKGASWEVLDLACTNSSWIHAIAPTFRDADLVSDLVPN